MACVPSCFMSIQQHVELSGVNLVNVNILFEYSISNMQNKHAKYVLEYSIQNYGRKRKTAKVKNSNKGFANLGSTERLLVNSHCMAQKSIHM